MHRVVIELERSVAVVAADGELDAFAEPDLTVALERVAAEPSVVVDLGRVTFLDSTALGAIVRSTRARLERGGEVRVVLPRGAARRIFEMTALDRALPVAESRASAIEDLARD